MGPAVAAKRAMPKSVSFTSPLDEIRDVARRDVGVNDARVGAGDRAIVRIVEGGEHFTDDVRDDVDVERGQSLLLGLLDERAQIHAVDPLHDQEGLPIAERCRRR